MTSPGYLGIEENKNTKITKSNLFGKYKKNSVQAVVCLFSNNHF